jgi:hypothetical protein
MLLVLLTTFFSAAMRRLTTTPVLKSANMSDGGDIWLSRGFSVTCILSAFIGAVMVGMLLGEPDVLTLFGALGGVMVGAVFYVVAVGVIRRLFWQRRSARPIERSERVFLRQQRLQDIFCCRTTFASGWSREEPYP